MFCTEASRNSSRADKRMDLAMLICDSKRLCPSTRADAQNSCIVSSPSINPGTGFAVDGIANHDMDGSLWSRLPEDLTDRVLAWLPAASLLRFRSVCRKWREIMATKCFLEVCSQVASYEPYFVKISNCEYSRSLLSFDPSVHKWHNLPISYLPSEVGFPVSSAGGLICFINKLQAHMDECGVLFVSNPLTKTWKELPRFLCKQRPVLVSMIMWKRPSHYKVIVAGVVSTEIFDSVAGLEQSEDRTTPRVLPIPQPGHVQGPHRDCWQIRAASGTIRVRVAPGVEDDEVARSGARAAAHVGSLLRSPIRELLLL